jgi:hypothetical protein
MGLVSAAGRVYTSAMREFIAFALVLLCALPAAPQTPPEGWKPVQDAKSACQIFVPPEWTSLGETTGAAVLHDPTTAIAVVTSQPGQEFKPFTASFLKVMGVPKSKLFENSATRIFYQDKTSEGRDDPSAFSASVPGKHGTCSCHIVVQPSIAEEIARKIALSLTPAPPKT